MVMRLQTEEKTEVVVRSAKSYFKCKTLTLNKLTEYIKLFKIKLNQDDFISYVAKS